MATAKRDQILQEAEKLAARGKLDAAIKEYRRAVDQAPNDTNTLNRLGDLLQRANRIPEAIDVYQRIAEHFSEDGFFLKAIAIHKKINRLDPQRTETYEKLADLYFKQGLIVEGRQQLLTLADWFLRSKQVPEAVRVFRRLAELEPTNLQARAKLVDLLAQSGDVSTLAVEIDPLGKALLSRGMLDEAIKLYHRALDLGPKSADFVAPCIEALVSASRFVPAKELADLALRSEGPGPELARAAARAYAETGDLKTARGVLEEVLQRAGQRVDLLQVLADVLLRVGDSDEAKERVLPVVDRLLEAGDVLRAGSLIKRLLRATPGDIAVLERALATFDRREDADMVATMEAALADAYFREEKRDAAVKLYRELARQDPANTLYTRRLQALGATSSDAVEAAPPAAPAAAPAPAAPPVAVSGHAAEHAEVEFVDVQVPIEEFEPVPAAPPATLGAQVSTPAGAVPPVPEALLPPAGVIPPPEPIPSFELPTEVPVLPEAVAAAAEEPPSAPPASETPGVTNAEELYTEAVVFAKYGLTEKAVSHVHRLLALDPGHRGGRELLASLGGEIVELDFAPRPEPAVPVLEVEQVRVELPRAPEPPPWTAPEQPPLPPPGAPPPPASRRSRVKLDDLEAILGLGGAEPPAGGGAAHPARRFEVPEIRFEPEALGLAVPPPRPAPTRREELPEVSLPSLPSEPATTTAVPPPVGEPEVEVEALEEPLELVEVGDVLAGPSEDHLREIDFFIEQGLLTEAAAMLRRLREASGDHPDVNSRMALLKARGWEEEREPAPVEASAAELFSEEDRFFDLAAELERELADEEIVAEATGVNAPGEVSIEELFKEFQKGVAEQLGEEDYDTHFNLGIAYREMGLLDEAIREFQLAAKSPELGVEATSMIGSCYLESGLAEQAADWYARALALPDLAPEVQMGLHYELGRAHEANGNIDGALASFAEVLAVNPSFRDVVARVARLRTN